MKLDMAYWPNNLSSNTTLKQKRLLKLTIWQFHIYIVSKQRQSNVKINLVFYNVLTYNINKLVPAM